MARIPRSDGISGGPRLALPVRGEESKTIESFVSGKAGSERIPLQSVWGNNARGSRLWIPGRFVPDDWVRLPQSRSRRSRDAAVRDHQRARNRLDIRRRMGFGSGADSIINITAITPTPRPHQLKMNQVRRRMAPPISDRPRAPKPPQPSPTRGAVDAETGSRRLGRLRRCGAQSRPGVNNLLGNVRRCVGQRSGDHASRFVSTRAGSRGA